MRAEQGLALVALILGIIGGVLLASGSIEIALDLLGGSAVFNSETLLTTGLGIAAIVASVVIWTGRFVAGGAANIVLGMVVIFYGEMQQGLIILVSGILGIVAPTIRD